MDAKKVRRDLTAAVKDLRDAKAEWRRCYDEGRPTIAAQARANAAEATIAGAILALTGTYADPPHAV